MPEKNILLFGSARESYSSSVKIDFPKIVKGKVIKDIIFQKLDKISYLKDCSMLAINQEYVNDFEVEINMDDVKEIAILPPLSGG
ncbi:ThiamineS/Molybdopterin converting factor subunit 1 family and Beta-grasp domain and Molybdopterin synthase/thiamin biosynthesis sulphur carrier, beta-grasp domain-containing protein [Strongyloides ratti]|uniref:ThiamineS/Molybdopterin converting factor subunit 1 family and Beta-grasp domain and Molybdopterin synthase/thiamin biosynthesis sulphur carrier, beta-grasp domain-containing protein n=1 Tax=Strongyloides ratti TaxID=34506 RepID=A0A090LF56_STRRB|nr:ThiamineS/Molybdopterin converting factor subunit 1 family and Beta-grasp domain and Molybdopterin synthase/thiamin biosynthesis sulphur carrier, beta-grasp domain-containing protein [Strongyloides ratti]CEF68402.1 ThiamineS/Molybdopterin converting factor subunit 1 family and Beta-grasp domain and Molybdopterin synthase/thiamin biosynthesis sulphur carrier, beta-grasp domain-containing protein [Strongyloides ratti]